MSRLRWLGVIVGALILGSAGAALGAEHGPSAGTASALDLHKLDWANVTLPGSVCGASRPIRLHHMGVRRAEGTAFFTPIPRRWSRDDFYGKDGVTVDSGWAPVVYGDLAGSGVPDDAGLVVDCNNGGGTADGVLLYAWVVFSGGGGKLSVVGVVTPQVQAPNELPTTVEIAIHRGQIIAHEFWYGPYDPTAGGSGRATTTWTYAHGTLRPGAPVITKHPNTAPP